MGKGDGRRVENPALIDANWHRAFSSWRCLARIPGAGLCNSINDDADAACTSCGAERAKGQTL